MWQTLTLPFLPGGYAWTPTPEGHRLCPIDADGTILGKPPHPRAYLALDHEPTRILFDAALVSKHVAEPAPSAAPSVVRVKERRGWLLAVIDSGNVRAAFLPVDIDDPITARAVMWQHPVAEVVPATEAPQTASASSSSARRPRKP